MFGAVNGIVDQNVELIQQRARGADSATVAWSRADPADALVALKLSRVAGKLPARIALSRLHTEFRDSLAQIAFKTAAKRRPSVDTAKYALVHSDDYSRQLLVRSSVRTIAPGVITALIVDEAPGVEGFPTVSFELDMEFRCATRQARNVSSRLLDGVGTVLHRTGPDTTYVDAEGQMLAALTFACPPAR